MRGKLLFWPAMVVVVYVSGLGPAAAPKFSEWSAPIMVANVNSEFVDNGPAISRNGRSLYFGSARPGGFGGMDLWVSRRASRKHPWGPPVNLGPTINTAANENVPAFSRDGHWMFFNSNRPGGSGLGDLWVSWRRRTNDDFGWKTPVNLGPIVNSPAMDAGASYFTREEEEDEEEEEDDEEEEEEADDDDDGVALLFFGSARPGGPGGSDIYVSAQKNRSFGPPTLISELSTSSNDQRPSIRSDGRELFFFSDRPGGVGSLDLWVATRDTLRQVWNAPENLGLVVNSTSNDTQGYISPDSRTLYFASNRPGGPGLDDLYVTARIKKGEDDDDADDDR